MNSLGSLVASLPEPSSYFAGLGAEPWCWPLNLIAFARRTRRDLQRRTFESRLHTRFVLVVNLETSGTLNLDSTPYPLRPGECHLIFPHQLHTYHDVASEEILWLFITFELPDETSLRILRQTTVVLDEEMSQLLASFLTNYRRRPLQAHRLQALLSDLLLCLVRSASRPQASHSTEVPHDDRLLDKIHRFHAQALPDALTVQALASKLALSESRLRARFRETFGLSLGGYLHNLRLQEAVSMMRHSKASLTDIAISCGYGSSSAFTRAFRSWAGVNPRSFRQTFSRDISGSSSFLKSTLH